MVYVTITFKVTVILHLHNAQVFDRRRRCPLEPALGAFDFSWLSFLVSGMIPNPYSIFRIESIFLHRNPLG